MEIRKKVLKIIIIIGLIGAIILPILNRYYFYPKKWKKSFYDLSAMKYKDVSEDRINRLTECVYEYFNNKYGAVNIPSSNDYTKIDLKAIGSCTIDYILDNDSIKNYARIHIDDIVNTMWEQKKQKE